MVIFGFHGKEEISKISGKVLTIPDIDFLQTQHSANDLLSYTDRSSASDCCDSVGGRFPLVPLLEKKKKIAN